MTVAHEFHSPKRKLARARSHISELESKIAGFYEGVKLERLIDRVSPSHGGLYDRWLNTYKFRCQQEGRVAADPPDEDAYVHRIHINLPPLGELDVISADAIQNLRQSLDHAACSCVRLIGKTDNGTYFSLVEHPELLEDRIKDQGRKLPASIKDIIRNAEPGGGLLYELHNLGGGDKHRLTCSFNYQGASTPTFIRASETGWIAAGFGPDEWDSANNDIRFALTGTPDELDYQFLFTVEIRFNASGVIATKPTIAALNEIANTVEGVIGEMETEMTRLLST